MHTRLTLVVGVLFVFAFATSVNAAEINFLPTDGTGDFGTSNVPKDAARLANGTYRWVGVAVVNGQNVARIWEVTTGGEKSWYDITIAGPTSSIAAAISPNGQFVLVDTTGGGTPSTAYRVELTTSGAPSIVNVTESELVLTPGSSDGYDINNAGVLVGSNNATPFRSAPGGAVLLSAPHNGGIARAISEDSSRIVGDFTDANGTLQAGFWDALGFHNASFGAFESELLGISDDGKLGAGHRDGFATWWDLDTLSYNSLTTYGWFTGVTNAGLFWGELFTNLGDEYQGVWMNGWDNPKEINAWLTSLGYTLPHPILQILAISDLGAELDIMARGSFMLAQGVPDPTHDPDPKPVPEPGSALLLLLGGLGALGSEKARLARKARKRS